MMITAQADFHRCAFQVITAHFVYHYTLKQALDHLESLKREQRVWINSA